MAKPIEFWFDFSSPYGYFAALQIEETARRHGRETAWRPFLLGVALQRTGMTPLTQQPMRGEYALHDWARLAREHKVPFRLPTAFPIASVAPARMVYAVQAEDPAAATRLALALFGALFGEDVDISDPARAAAAGARAGLSDAELARAAADPRWKEVLRQQTDEALAKGVFGSPFFIVDGEPFWGSDRLAMLDRWLGAGGW